jgi:hypothetical protein
MKEDGPGGDGKRRDEKTQDMKASGHDVSPPFITEPARGDDA